MTVPGKMLHFTLNHLQSWSFFRVPRWCREFRMLQTYSQIVLGPLDHLMTFFIFLADLLYLCNCCMSIRQLLLECVNRPQTYSNSKVKIAVRSFVSPIPKVFSFDLSTYLMLLLMHLKVTLFMTFFLINTLWSGYHIGA